MTLALRQYQTAWPEFDTTWVAIPRNEIYEAHKIKFSGKGTPFINGRFGDIKGRDLKEFLTNVTDYLIHAKLYKDTWHSEIYNTDLSLLGSFEVVETWAKNLQTGARENSVISEKPQSLEAITKHKDKLLKQIAKRIISAGN